MLMQGPEQFMLDAKNLVAQTFELDTLQVFVLLEIVNWMPCLNMVKNGSMLANSVWMRPRMDATGCLVSKAEMLLSSMTGLVTKVSKPLYLK